MPIVGLPTRTRNGLSVAVALLSITSPSLMSSMTRNSRNRSSGGTRQALTSGVVQCGGESRRNLARGSVHPALELEHDRMDEFGIPIALTAQRGLQSARRVSGPPPSRRGSTASATWVTMASNNARTVRDGNHEPSRMLSRLFRSSATW